MGFGPTTTDGIFERKKCGETISLFFYCCQEKCKSIPVSSSLLLGPISQAIIRPNCGPFFHDGRLSMSPVFGSSFQRSRRTKNDGRGQTHRYTNRQGLVSAVLAVWDCRACLPVCHWCSYSFYSFEMRIQTVNTVYHYSVHLTAASFSSFVDACVLPLAPPLPV